MITKTIDKKSIREIFFDIILLIGLLGVATITGLMIFRTWEMFVSFIGIRLAITFVISFVVVTICLVHTTVTNLAWNISLIDRYVYTESETDGV